MKKVDIGMYPMWLRPYIESEMTMAREHGDGIKELQVILNQMIRHDPIAKILFFSTVEGIRQRFKIQALEQEILQLRAQVANQNFSKKEILALKACAAQKMSEPTPEEEAEWDQALEDNYGSSQ